MPTSERTAAAVAGFTVGDVARSLRRTRTRQGLSLADVSSRTGVPVGQLRAAETGALDLPDQLATLKTVRRYADFLGLPGDRYALALLEHWPTKAGLSSRPATGPGPSTAVIGVGALAVGAGAPALGHDTATIGPVTGGAVATSTLDAEGGSDQLGTAGVADDPVTATIGAAASPPDAAAQSTTGTSGALYAYQAAPSMPAAAPYAYQDTGVTPAIRSGVGPVRRRRRPALLKALVGMTAAAVVLGGAGLVLAHEEPHWLHDLGISRPSAGHSASASRAAGSASSSPVTAAPAQRAGHHGSGVHDASATATAAVQPDPTSTTSATIRISSSHYSVTVSATAPCWVDVTTATSGTSLFAGVLTTGEHRTFAGQPGLRVQLGSAAGRLSATSGTTSLLATYAPPVAPFTATFTG